MPACERARAAYFVRARRRCRRQTTLDRALRDASPQEVIAAALKTVGRDRLALVSSFGTQSAALLKVMADVDPAIPVIFLDTGWLFEETLAYRDTLIAKLGLARRPLDQAVGRDAVARGSRARSLVLQSRRLLPHPQSRAAGSARCKPFDAWINGRKRFQGGLRADIAVVEQDGARLKFNPFANVSREEIEAIFKRRESAAASAGRLRLPLGRLHALHQPHLGR